jgi:hypothetical protein
MTCARGDYAAAGGRPAATLAAWCDGSGTASFSARLYWTYRAGRGAAAMTNATTIVGSRKRRVCAACSTPAKDFPGLDCPTLRRK